MIFMNSYYSFICRHGRPLSCYDNRLKHALATGICLLTSFSALPSRLTPFSPSFLEELFAVFSSKSAHPCTDVIHVLLLETQGGVIIRAVKRREPDPSGVTATSKLWGSPGNFVAVPRKYANDVA